MRSKSADDLCVYCARRPGVTDDHVFARSLFAVVARTNLPKVPACAARNSEKAALERYLAAVLPFGAVHADAARPRGGCAATLGR